MNGEVYVVGACGHIKGKYKDTRKAEMKAQAEQGA